MRKTFMLFVVSALLLMIPLVAAAQDAAPVPGTYAITGQDPNADPGQGQYSGEVELSLRGEGYVFSGMIDGTAFEGCGLYDPQARILSLAYDGADAEDQGVTVLHFDGQKLSGRFMNLFDETGSLGTEVWVLKP